MSTVVHAVRRGLGSPVAWVYLVVCAALLVWSVISMSTHEPDASMAGVIPLFATAPVSLVLLALPEHASMFYLSVTLGALVNACVLGWCVRALTGSLRRG